MAHPRCRKCGSLEWVIKHKDQSEIGRCSLCRTFPTLGYGVGQWIEQHCAVPDRDEVGEPFRLTQWQWKFLLNFYRVSPFAQLNDRGKWTRAFHFSRGGQLVRSQKNGKGPLSAAIMCAEAVGPVLFDGWDSSGQPVGRRWPTPIIQISASSEDQTDNVWMALLPMVALGEFSALIPDTAMKRIFLPEGGWIEPVASAARSRLGQRVTFIVMDQTESWLESNGGRKFADTMRRNLAGTGGRWLSTCNAWDPAEGSVAQYTAEIEAAQGDVYNDDIEPPPNLSIRNKAERRRALRHVYQDSHWIDLDRIDSEVVALMNRDAAQAERFFLNRKEAAESVAFQPDVIDSCIHPERMEADKSSRIVLFADGARFVDSLAIVATDVIDGFQWPIGIWERPESASDDYEHPMDEVDWAVADAFKYWDVWRFYVDPQYIEGLLEMWQGRYKERRVIEWRTNRPRQIAHSVRQYSEALISGNVSLSSDETFIRHLKNARRQKLNVYDDDHRQMHTIAKDRPGSPRKMDGAMAAVGSYEAFGDCVAKGANRRKAGRASGFN